MRITKIEKVFKDKKLVGYKGYSRPMTAQEILDEIPNRIHKEVKN